jgi:endonuclease G, mitochondrial
MTRTCLFICLCLSFFYVHAQEPDPRKEILQNEQKLEQLRKEEQSLLIRQEQLKLEKIRKDIADWAMPSVTAGGILIRHTAMTLCFDKKYMQATWVVHFILPDIINGNASRSNDFRVDSLVPGGSANKEDYWMSGYDRGHLAPSADFRWSKSALSESYYYSNMSPQKPELNREKWADLENIIRQYVADTKEPVCVITGGILSPEDKTIGSNKVAVPQNYYKVVVDNEGPGKKGIGFIMPNMDCTKPLISYAVSIDSVEKATGIDFFPALSDTLENKLESQFDYSLWVTEKEKGDALPLEGEQLPNGAINSLQAKDYIDKKTTVCGTVVSTKLVEKSGTVLINLDTKWPNQVFTISIFASNRVNFSYKPEVELINERICITGTVTEYKGKPSMSIKNEKAIWILTDEQE